MKQLAFAILFFLFLFESSIAFASGPQLSLGLAPIFGLTSTPSQGDRQIAGVISPAGVTFAIHGPGSRFVPFMDFIASYSFEQNTVDYSNITLGVEFHPDGDATTLQEGATVNVAAKRLFEPYFNVGFSLARFFILSEDLDGLPIIVNSSSLGVTAAAGYDIFFGSSETLRYQNWSGLLYFGELRLGSHFLGLSSPSIQTFLVHALVGVRMRF